MLNKTEIEIIEKLINAHICGMRDSTAYNNYVEDHDQILSKLNKMYSNLDFKCDHVNTYWSENEICDDCGSIIC